jgi:hypothetical protein
MLQVIGQLFFICADGRMSVFDQATQAPAGSQSQPRKQRSSTLCVDPTRPDCRHLRWNDWIRTWRRPGS